MYPSTFSFATRPFDEAVAGAATILAGSAPLTLAPAIVSQVERARAVLARHLGETIVAIHLFGSAVDGGLQPHSDIDLLVTIAKRPSRSTRAALMADLLRVSAPVGQDATLRPLEVTVVVLADVVPWRYPARRELQFGEWLRADLVAGKVEPARADVDLAVLLTKILDCSVAIEGPAAEALFVPVPVADFRRALADTLMLWQEPADWAGDERNVVLTLARIWYSAVTGRIASKHVAADWAIGRLPPAPGLVLADARQAYLGLEADALASCEREVTASVRFVKARIETVLDALPRSRPRRFSSSSSSPRTLASPRRRRPPVPRAGPGA